jgi:hypothetical protein
VEEPGTFLNSLGDDEDTDQTDGEDGKHDPEGRVAWVGGMEESDVRGWLSRSAYVRARNDSRKYRLGGGGGRCGEDLGDLCLREGRSRWWWWERGGAGDLGTVA